MNYEKHYALLIERAKNRVITNEYTERHHIVPKCLGGSNKKNNLVDLFPEEHYVAHQLLVKIYPSNHRLVTAATMMCVSSDGTQVRNNKLYSWLRKKHANSMSILQNGTANSQYGTRWIYNKDLKISKKIPVDKDIPNGWNLGRILNWEKLESKILQTACIQCGKMKSSLNKFCSHSCSTTYEMANRDTIFDLHLDDIITDYKNGMSVYQCLISRNLCGTGKNHTKLKNILKNL